ncbi:Glycerol-3-phosphate acyltransferase 4 [Frankliniella fusca]|uniref:Glycerol-3-phosphate acyltransferase 4 n=1 Tax=Frankliniella fusca TaxID=407009 RepID=A0AAE1I4B4_9NEOP|nr:Glycerol-3-phosphate acyltransferase 4 [Frankliniella fusca]KAK3910053.1 Glycerol-3-phosphate acyltransferase 4 [Frankliniella fusca]KAK3920525.1 Glycerol-3-phosphate acyltransferase 4 [Frankliniella fusca]KAK3920612.1 Glycerol-3-phosphate acyltransferase 4 [Frankliniella fusca]KAK3931891.1 Glycerol-3-phosphate acyltransferase 4 [Frankliniella fusca]
MTGVHSCLKAHAEGKVILSFFNKFKSLDNTRREDLATRVVYAELQSDLSARLKKDTFQRLANEICALFPTECPTTWYAEDVKKNRTIISGRLKHKFYNLRRNFLKVGLISSARLRSELESDEDLDLTNNQDIDDDEDILWLVVHDAPFVEVLNRWENSQDIRKVLLRQLSCSAYVAKFPFLKKSRGWELLVYEAELQHPDWKDRVTTHWPKFLKFLGSRLNAESDGAPLILSSVSKLFRPRTLPKSPDAPKNSKCWRPSRAEVQASFFLHINEPAQLQESLNARKEILFKYKLTLQPLVVAIGGLSDIKQVLIVVDNHKWEVDSVLQGVDVCFKVFFALNSCYPSEARHLWLLIQRAVYDLELAADFDGEKGLKSYMASYLKDFSLFED